jgi:hypothetical protein
MSLDPQQLAAAVLAGDVRQVRGLLRDATEADRRACAESLKSFLIGPEIHRRPSGQDEEGLTQEGRVLLKRRYTRLGAAAVAVKSGLADGLRTALTAAGAMSWISPWDDDFDEIANVYADRRPPWLAELAGRRLQERFLGDGVFVGSQGGLEPWPMARRLVRLGAIARPAIAQYTTRMPISLYHEGWVSAGQPPSIVWQPDARPGLLYHPLDGLLADPGLLDDEVWRLFEVPGATQALTKCKGTWEEALVKLSERGLLDRGRLLDACLDAFFKDFAPTQVGWYATFHGRMVPTLDEVAARTGRYVALLATNSAHGVSLAQRACDRLLAAGRLPLADFLAASPPLLLFPQKGVATRQLKLLAKIAREPSLRPQALATAAGAFGHARLDVQEAALDLIGKLGVPEGAEAAVIAGQAAYLAPALTSKAVALGLLAAAPAPVAAPAGIPLTPVPPAVPPPPLEDPAALIRLLTQLMEDAPDALSVEHAMAGAVRLATLPPSDRERLGSPLVKRAEELVSVSGSTRHPHALSEGIARLALAWACVPCPPPAWLSDKTVPLTMIPAVRAFEACRLIEGGPAGAELLAEPSAADGSVHPDALLARLATWLGAPVFRYDMEVALLRLPPVDASFWVAWDEVHPASAELARQAYQARTAKLTIEPVIETAPDRLGRSRTSVLARITSDPPAAAGASRCWQVLTEPPDPILHYDFGSRTSPVVASWPLLCPWQPELAAAHLLRPLSECLVPGSRSADPGATAVIGLTRSSAPLGPIRHLALLTGLGSAEASVRIAAADVWTQAALAGRLDPNLAADALVKGVTGEAIKLTRLTDGLRHASRQPASAQMIARVVFASAGHLVSAKSPNLHLLLELTREIGAAIALPELPESIVALAAEKGSTKLAAAARQLVER